MSLLIPCSTCGGKLPGKLANVTIAWYTAAQERLAYRLKLCLGCYAAQVAPLQPDPAEASLKCPVCHSDPGEQLDPVYVTSYLPDYGKVQMELATCAPCAVKLRVPAQAQGVKLENQFGGQDPGPQTRPTGTDGWASVGLYPRE